MFILTFLAICVYCLFYSTRFKLINRFFLFLFSLLLLFSLIFFNFRRNEHRVSKLFEIGIKKICERSHGLNLFFVPLHESKVGNNKAELLRDGREITTDRDLSPSRSMIKRFCCL